MPVFYYEFSVLKIRRFAAQALLKEGLFSKKLRKITIVDIKHS